MNIRPLPDSVEKALGKEAARDLAQWLQTIIAEVAQTQYPISAFVARQRVNVLMLQQVSNLLMSGDPVMIHREDGKVVWRVPIYFCLSRRGRIGQVGALDVGAHLGDISWSQDDLLDIAKRAEQLAREAFDQM